MISLAKGQTVSLEKRSGGGLKQIVMGLAWDVAKPKRGFLSTLFAGRAVDDVDLDASCVLFDAGGLPVDTVWFQQLQSIDGSVLHTGDNRTGSGDGDDEQIKVDLTRLPTTVQTLVFVVNSFTGETFGNIGSATCRIVDEASGEEVARYDLSNCGGSHTAQVMAKVHRVDGAWKMTAVGEICTGRTFHDLMPTMRRCL